MQTQELLRMLRKYKLVLCERFDMTDLRLVGSFARDEASDDCDIDLIVKFDGPTTSKRFFGVQFYLEDVLGRTVDLMTEKGLHEGMHPYVEQESIRV